MTINLVEGWTAAVEWLIKFDNVPQALDDLVCSLLLYDKNGTLLGIEPPDTNATPPETGLPGTFEAVLATTGKVRYMPAPSELSNSKSPYEFRVRLRDTAGHDVFSPDSTARDKWFVAR